MKKLFPLALALLLLLSACSITPPSLTSTPSPTSSESASPTEPAASPTLSAMNKVTTEVRQPTFCVLLPDYGTVMNPWYTYYEFPQIDYDNLQYYEVADTRCYSGDPAKGFSIALYTAPKNTELNQIVLRLDLDASDENTQKSFFDFEKAIIYGLDFDSAETILTSLDYTNITDGVMNEYDSAIAGYVYHVDANIVELFIMAK